MRQRRWKTFVLFAILLDRSARDQILQFLVSAQPQHLLATAGRVSCPEIFVDDIEKLFELERRTPGKDRYQFLGYEIRNAARECIFL